MLPQTPTDAYQATVRQQLNQNYQLFVSSFAYTIAADVLTNLVDVQHSMFVTALTLVTGLAVLGWAKAELDNIIDSKTDATLPDTSSLGGPLRMLRFVLVTAQPVVVNFLSIAMGRWIVEMHKSDALLAVTLPTLATGVALLYLLGTSANFV